MKRFLVLIVAVVLVAGAFLVVPAKSEPPPHVQCRKNPAACPTTTTSSSTTTSVTSSTTTTAPPSGTVFDVPLSIPADCSVDVTAALNNWIRSVPDGTSTTPNTLRFRPGCFRVDGVLINPRGSVTPERHNLVFDGNGATLNGSWFVVPSPTSTKINHSLWTMIHPQNVTIKNFTMLGQHPNPCNLDTAGNCRDGGAVSAYEWYAGIAVEGGRDLVFSNNTIRNMYGDGISVAQGPNCYQGPDVWGADHPINVTIADNLIDGTGRHGVAITGGEDVVVARNTFDRVSYHVADLEYECYQPLKRITFDRNIIQRHYLAFIASITGGEAGVCPPTGFNGDFTITNNVMERSGVTTTMPIWVGSTQPTICQPDKSDVRIEGNTLLYAHAEGTNSAIQIDTTLGAITILSNRIVQPGTAAAVKITRSASAAKTVSLNDMRESALVYWLDGVAHAAGVTSCGNTTSQGPNQPTAC